MLSLPAIGRSGNGGVNIGEKGGEEENCEEWKEGKPLLGCNT